MPSRFALRRLLFGLVVLAPAAALAAGEGEAKRIPAPVGGTAPSVAAVAVASTLPVASTPAVTPAAPPASVATAAPAPSADTQRFCQNVASAAADARFALQTRKLNELAGQIAARVTDLEDREARLKEVLARHDEAEKRAQASLVGIYAKMRPDAAAQQISALDDGTAAAVLSGLNPRQASAILNEITPDRAVKLVNTISGLVPAEKKS